MTDLSVLTCDSEIRPEFFYRLAQLCHNIQSLCIIFEIRISNVLKDLISAQINLKHLTLQVRENYDDWSDFISSLTNTRIL